MDKFIKRIQSRVSRKGGRVTKDQVRAVYTELVTALDAPTDEEMTTITDLLCSQNQEKAITPVTPQQSAPTPQAKPQNNQLTTTNRTAIQSAPTNDSNLTQQAIQQAVEQEFGKENVETKQAILNYVAQDTFATAQELQASLAKLRSMRQDILMKLISDHNQASSDDENALKTALLNATNQRQRETEDFFTSFDSQLVKMRSAFGI